MGLYEELIAMKANGEDLDLADLSPGALRSMFIGERITDSMIADLYEVKKSKIAYMRRKYGITIHSASIDSLLLGKTAAAKEMNAKVKNEILKKANIDMISKAVTHFAFRNGPIEDMHASPNSQLSDADMKTLNKFTVNRLAYVFTLMIEERWLEFDFLVRDTDRDYGHDWDEAEPDDGDTRKIIDIMLAKNEST